MIKQAYKEIDPKTLEGLAAVPITIELANARKQEVNDAREAKSKKRVPEGASNVAPMKNVPLPTNGNGSDTYSGKQNGSGTGISGGIKLSTPGTADKEGTDPYGPVASGQIPGTPEAKKAGDTVMASRNTQALLVFGAILVLFIVLD